MMLVLLVRLLPGREVTVRLFLVVLVLLVLLALGERSLVMLVLLVRLLPGREVTVPVRSFVSHGVLPSPFGLVRARERHSTQSNVRVTAFFHRPYPLSRSAASIRGCHSLSFPQFARRSSTSFQKPTASPAA